MGGNGVFQRQCVQAELIAEAADGLAVGRLQLNPDEAIRLADMLADVVKRDRLGLRLVVTEEQAVNLGLRWDESKQGDSMACSGQLHLNSILGVSVRYSGGQSYSVSR